MPLGGIGQHKQSCDACVRAGAWDLARVRKELGSVVVQDLLAVQLLVGEKASSMSMTSLARAVRATIDFRSPGARAGCCDFPRSAPRTSMLGRASSAWASQLPIRRSPAFETLKPLGLTPETGTMA